MTAPVTSDAIIDGVDVDGVAAAVTACAGVTGLFGGRSGAIASYLPGRRVPGVEVTRAAVVVHVISRWDATAAGLLRAVSAAVTPLLGGKTLEVVVEDLDDGEARRPGSAPPAEPPASPAPPKFPTV